MSKTPDELAIDYCEPILSDDYARAIGREDWIGTRCVKVGEGHEMYKAFLAGYKAAMNENKPKVQELEANWKFCCEDKARLLNELAAAERAKEQVADVSKVMPQWISVKDRLPEYTPMVLAMCTDGYELAYYGMYGQGWTNTLGTEHLNVTHWHPLPAPPKEEK